MVSIYYIPKIDINHICTRLLSLLPHHLPFCPILSPPLTPPSFPFLSSPSFLSPLPSSPLSLLLLYFPLISPILLSSPPLPSFSLFLISSLLSLSLPSSSSILSPRLSYSPLPSALFSPSFLLFSPTPPLFYYSPCIPSYPLFSHPLPSFPIFSPTLPLLFTPSPLPPPFSLPHPLLFFPPLSLFSYYPLLSLPPPSSSHLPCFLLSPFFLLSPYPLPLLSPPPLPSSVRYTIIPVYSELSPCVQYTAPATPATSVHLLNIPNLIGHINNADVPSLVQPLVVCCGLDTTLLTCMLGCATNYLNALPKRFR